MKRLLYLYFLFVTVLANAQTTSFKIIRGTSCPDTCIKFINTSTAVADSITWAIPGITITNPHDDTIGVCFSTFGLDTVNLYVYDSGRIDTVIHVVTIAPIPHPTMGCSNFAPNGYAKYHWYCNGYLQIDDTTNNYVRCSGWSWVIVIDSAGCSGSSDSCFVAEGKVNNVSSTSSQMMLYPNPASNELTVRSIDNVTRVVITNMLGKTVFSTLCNSHQVHVDVADLPKGLYILKINGTENKKFVKE